MSPLGQAETLWTSLSPGPFSHLPHHSCYVNTDVVLVQRNCPGWGLGQPPAGAELAILSCLHRKPLCHVSHKGMKHAVIIVPVMDHRDIIIIVVMERFGSEICTNSSPPSPHPHPVKVKSCCTLL